MPHSARRPGFDPSAVAGLAAVVAFFVASGLISYLNTASMREGSQQVRHTHEVLAALDDVLSLLKDAETGQRGFVITGDDRYLEPHAVAVERLDGKLQEVDRLTRDNPEQKGRLPGVREQITVKLRELAETIKLRRGPNGFEAAKAVVVTDRGRAAMDEIRAKIEGMEQVERTVRARRLAEMDSAYAWAVASGLLSAVLGILVTAAVAGLVQRAAHLRRRQEWLLTGQNRLSAAMVGDQRLEQLGESVLTLLAQYVGAAAGAFFARNVGGFRRVATYGVPAGGVPERFGPDDGLLGQAAKGGKTFVLSDVPEGYLAVGSALGRASPRHLVVAPVAADGAVNAVYEFGFLRPPDGHLTELLERVAESVGVAVRSANDRARLHDLLEETQRQSEEMQAQAEELRVSNEELEEQGQALKESQTRLEQQQVEMEQTNVRLEERTQLLAAQRDDLTRTKNTLQSKARELAQASQYKTDFLANMSHELRTPLNSSLILAKLLADNPKGNLTEEQVKFAQTIGAAGNDLLTLINDILDLSKIEAGKMEVRPETVRVVDLLGSLTRTFEPVAREKGLTFRATGGPDEVTTDRQRLEQVLKNLLSNGLKFTERGEVTLTVSRADGKFAFAVTDTGIGIPAEQHEAIFEAFRQADGNTNRRYGGSGLGLSISRELTRLLGGELRLESEPGRGSTFTVTIPDRLDAPRVEAPAPAPVPAPAPLPPPKRVADDRERPGGRVILVVEDDETFAGILTDLARELDFKCLVATTAEEAIAVATQHLPSAVVLDIGLPDHSGLSVLDRLKHDARTRHIPVHVVSGGDYAQTALALGAVGYMLKPVKREELMQTLKSLGTRLETDVRRVLVVEDDPVQLDSLRKLLATQQVETVGAATAAECLDRLRTETYDCMVLDLSLPDASGYSLLETLSREDAYSFPPVIVYTGRDLSADEEQRLRRYSKSIIIKGAKSPERLLDEVTLFLHQVVADLPAEQQRMLEKARSRDAALEGRRILVVEDDVRNVFALTSILEPRGAVVKIARNGREALAALDKGDPIDLVLMDVMMPEMDGLTATREIRKRAGGKKLPVIMLTAKAMKDDQEQCLAAGANDYMAKPLDVEKLLSLVRVWMPR